MITPMRHVSSLSCDHDIQVRSAVQLAEKALQGQRGESRLFEELWRALSQGQERAESTAICCKSAPSSATPLRSVPEVDTPSTTITPRMNTASERNYERNNERNNERSVETNSKGGRSPGVHRVTSETPVATMAAVRPTVSSSSRRDASTVSIPPHTPRVPLDGTPRIPPRTVIFIPTDNKENNPAHNPTHTGHTVHTPSTPSTPSTPTPAVIVPSAATRLALVNFAAEAARKRSAAIAATAAAAAAVNIQSTAAVSSAQPVSQVAVTAMTATSAAPSSSSSRAPLRALPPSLQEQILKGQRALENTSQTGSGQSSRDKWVRPKGLSPEKQDLKSVIEKRIGAMR